MKAKKTIQQPKVLRVLVAIPCYQYVEPDCFKSVYRMEIPENVETDIAIISGYTVTQARNRIVEAGLSGKFDYTLFIDSDVVIPPNLLSNLLKLCEKENGADLATGWYIKKIPNPKIRITEIYTLKFGQDGIENVLEKDMPTDGRILPIAACGFGCTLIKNAMLPKVNDGMYFEYIERQMPDKSGIIISEDIQFCNKAFRAGLKMVVDTSLRCPHIGKMHF